MPQLAVFATTKFWLNEVDTNQKLLREHLTLSLSMRTWLCGGQVIRNYGIATRYGHVAYSCYLDT